MNETSIVIIGGRGNGTVMASTIEDCRKAGQRIRCAGFLNDFEEGEIDGYPILGTTRENSWKNLPEDYQFLYALNNAKKAFERFKLLQSLEIPRDRFARVIHPTAVVSDHSEIGKGVVIMPLCVIGPGAKIDDHSVVYAQALVGHDSHLGEMVFVANNASIGAHISIERGVHIGSNASLLEKIQLHEFSLVGLGSVVLKDVAPFSKVAGIPAKLIGKIES